MRLWQRSTVLTIGVLLALTACSSSPNGTSNLDSRVQRMVPTGAPSVPMAPRDGQPDGTRLVTGKYFTIYVPTTFTEKSSPMENGEQMISLTAPSNKPAAPVLVGVLPDTKGPATAIEQSYTVELTTRNAGVTDLTRSTVKWPGAQNAILLQWTQRPVRAPATAPATKYWQLMAQVNNNLIVSVLAMAPAETFDAAGLSKIMETFRPRG